MKSYSVEAVVLRMRALGEADRIVTLFSRERGKLQAVAKGARKIRSKFGARLDFFSRVSLMLHTGRTLDVITSVQTVKAVWEELVSPDTYAVTSYVAESIDALCEPDLAVPELYETLCEFQDALVQHVDHGTLLAAFDLRILGALGLGPELDTCARCNVVLGRRPLSGGRAWLSPQAGGLLCQKCVRQVRADLATRTAGRALLSMSSADFTQLRGLRSMSFAELNAPRKDGAALHRATRAFLEYHTGGRSKALSVIGADARFERSVAHKA